jgi:hypothetical protein
MALLKAYVFPTNEEAADRPGHGAGRQERAAALAGNAQRRQGITNSCPGRMMVPVSPLYNIR